MKIISKILVPILISTLLLTNVGFNVIYHTCNSTGEINISLFIEQMCQNDDCSVAKIIGDNENKENNCCDSEKSGTDLHKDNQIKSNKSINNSIDYQKYASNSNKDNNYTSILDECCNSETDFIQTKLNFTINYVDFNFKSDLVIGETLKLKINDLNKDYKVILDNIDSKIKKIPSKSLSYLIKYIYSTNSNKESYIY